jgi:hypothetical protein
MNSTIKRLIGASGAAAVVAGAALMAAPAAQADGGYYGTWTLEAFKVGSQTIDCPGKLPFPPPAPTIECKGGDTLKLKSDYTYKTTLDVFRGTSGKGEFEVIKFSTNEYQTMIFDSYEVRDDPRSFQVKFQGKTSAGTPKKMVLSRSALSVSGEEITVKLIFRRDAD